MKDEELYDAFSDKDVNGYMEEAKERWGNTDAYKQSMERTSKMTKAQMQKFKEDSDRFMKEFASHIDEGATSAKIQEMIGQHYNALRTFYEPTLELYRGLAEMYVADPRFTTYYEAYRPGLATFMYDAMLHFVNEQESSQP